MLIDRSDLPKHLFGILDLDLSDDLCAELLARSWFKLGACSTGSGRDKQGVESVVYRQSMLLSPEDFSVIFDKLESNLGQLCRVVRHRGPECSGDQTTVSRTHRPLSCYARYRRAAVEPKPTFAAEHAHGVLDLCSANVQI